MADKPILFSAPMVRALLAGTKTQTRRTLKPQPPEWQAQVIDITKPFFDEENGGWGQVQTEWSIDTIDRRSEPQREVWVPLRGLRYAVADRLWVREAWRTAADLDHLSPAEIVAKCRETGPRRAWCPIDYAADGAQANWNCWSNQERGRKRVGMHMPRDFSRLSLTVTDVRVQRLQEISADDCRAEGHPVEPWRSSDPAVHDDAARDWYCDLWDDINGAGAWAANPWIAAYTFTVEHANIDAGAPS